MVAHESQHLGYYLDEKKVASGLLLGMDPSQQRALLMLYQQQLANYMLMVNGASAVSPVLSVSPPSSHPCQLMLPVVPIESAHTPPTAAPSPTTPMDSLIAALVARSPQLVTAGLLPERSTSVLRHTNASFHSQQPYSHSQQPSAAAEYVQHQSYPHLGSPVEMRLKQQQQLAQLALSPQQQSYSPRNHSPMETVEQKQQQLQQQQPLLFPQQPYPQIHSPMEMSLNPIAQLNLMQLAMQQQADQQHKQQRARENLQLMLALRDATSIAAGKTAPPSTTESPMEVTPKREVIVSPRRPFVSTASLILPTPETTPSPSTEASSPLSVETERPQSSKEKDDDEEAFFVDVESLDDRVSAKGQRKAHIDFYRKLKALRQREKVLECQMCHEKVDNGEHSVRTHVHSHSEMALYRCKMCGAESKVQNAMFAHIKQHHPNRVHQGHDGFEDRRDMNNLSNILLKCFPRATAKTRVGYNELVDKVCRTVEANSLTKIKCALCMKCVTAHKSQIARHPNSHPYYRCKQCKLTCSEQDGVIEHCAKMHNVLDPKIGADFNVCSAAEVMACVLRKCFPTLCEGS